MEGKAITGPDGPWPPRRERALAHLIEEVHGDRCDGDPLNASPVSFDSGMNLARGEREPTPSEVGPLGRFKRSG